MEITVKIDERLNFFAILHNLLKEKHKASYHRIREAFSLPRNDETMRKRLRQAIRGFKDSELEQMYSLRNNVWRQFWKDSEQILHRIAEKIQLELSSLNQEKFNDCASFFESTLPNRLTVLVFGGNESKAGTGLQLSKDIVWVFPRLFSSTTPQSIVADVAVVIHEIVHTLQEELNEPPSELREQVTRAFAPRGILIQEDLIEKKEPYADLVPLIRGLLKEGKTYRESKEILLDRLCKINYLSR